MAKTVADWIQDLQSNDKTVWKEAVRALSYIGADAIQPLLNAIVDKSIPQERISQTLAQMGQDAVESMNQMLVVSPDASHRILAAEVIARIRDVRYLPALMQALYDSEATVRASVALSLQEFNDPRAVAPLLKTTHDDDELVRANSALALGSYYRDGRSKQRLLELVQDESPIVRRSVVRALASFSTDKDITPIVHQMTNDEDRLVRQFAAASLLALQGDKMAFQRIDLNTNEITKIANEAYERMVEDGVLDDADLDIMRHSNPIVRARLLEAVSDQGRETALNLVLPALNDINPAVRKTAVDALVRMGSEGFDALASHLNDNSKYVRAGILEAFGIMREARCLDMLPNLLNDRAVEVRLQAVKTAMLFEDDRAIKILQIARKDSERDVRELAEEHLEKIGATGGDNPLSRLFRRIRGND
jgi:HEAT repeat protein